MLFGGTPALEGVDLSVEPGEKLAVIGASGAGKTTLFRVLTRSVALAGGRVVVGGHDLYTLGRRELRGLRRRVGTIHQSYNLVPQLPAGVNAALGEVGGMGTFGTLRTILSGPGEDLSGRVAGRWIGSGCRRRLARGPRTSRAVSSSGLRWRASWCSALASSSPTSRWPPWTP